MINNSTDIDYKALYEQSQLTISLLKQELAQLKKLISGSTQERFIPTTPNNHQLSLDISVEQEAVCQVTAAKQVAYTRTKVQIAPVPHPGRNKLPEHLRREEIILEPQHVPASSKKIGEQITE